MAPVRYLVPVLVAGFVGAVPLGAQEAPGGITGRVIDAMTQQPLNGVTVTIVGTPRATSSDSDGEFVLSGVPAGTHTLRAIRIGYGPQQQEVTVTAGVTATVQFALQAQAALLEAVVVTGYGTQRREAITGSVSSIDATEADVGVVTNVNQMLQGRAAGVTVIQNNGEPGSGAQVRIRGGTSISASNEPLYVIDGVIISNVPTEAAGFGISGNSPPQSRSPLNLLNPSDIASITVLKDAAATAIYGSRAANGVILIETKKAASGGVSSVEYDGYIAIASPSRRLDLLDANQYREFVQSQVAIWKADSAAGVLEADRGGLSSSHLATLGTANTDWEREVTRTAVTHNHNLSFAGGVESTRYRASLNYMKQEGVAISSGLERIQGRLNATHSAFDNRLRLGLNVTTSHTSNDYIAYDNTGGFEGGVFHNVAIFNPTQPVTMTDPSTDQSTYFEIAGQRSVRNPVALAEQIVDDGSTTRTLGNVSAELDLVSGLTAQVNVGVDRSDGERRTYLPKASPVGAEFDGLSRLANRDNSTVTLQTLLTLRRTFADIHTLDVVGGYEFSEFKTGTFVTDGRGYVTDGLLYNNPGAARTLVDSGGREESRQVAFLARANYGLNDRYFLTGVLRYDGSSRFAEGHKWALFPALSASWRISEEEFMSGGVFSDLRLRAGWGLQGNPGVPPYSSLALLQPTSGARYPFGDAVVFGVIPTREENRDLKWEESSQFNVALDYGFSDNRFSGSVEYYVKNTSDLLLEVANPQPSFAERQLQNVGKVRNRGFEISLDAVALSRPNLTWRAGLVFAAERNEVVDLGPFTSLLTGSVSGQGQSNVFAQSIMPGHPLGTFFGPRFLGIDAQGRQLFACSAASAGCVNGETTTPLASDYEVIGDANPDFTLGLHSQVHWGRFDVSLLIRAAVGQDVFNNTALVYSTKSDAIQDKNFLVPALSDGTALNEPAKYSSRWIEGASFVRLQNLTVEYQLDLPMLTGPRTARLYVSADNLLLLTGYSGLDPEVHAEAGLASRGVDYLSYPRPRTITAGLRTTF